MLIAAIKVVDALDGRGPLGGEPGEHERGAGAEIRGHDRSPGKALDAAYDGCMPGKADIRAHADELLHVHEPVFKNGFADDPGTFGKAHEGHDLRLHVRREAGEGLRGHVHPAQGAGAAGQHAVGGGFDFHAHLAHFSDHGVKLLKGAVREQQLAVGDPGGGEEGSRLDAVGHDAVGAASEARDALNADDAGAVAFDARAAGDKEAGKIDDFGLAGGVLKDGFSIGQCGCHEQVFRTADGGKVEMDVRAVELAAAAENIPVLKIEPRPHLFEG